MIDDNGNGKDGWIKRHPNNAKMPAGIDPDAYVEVRQESGAVSDIPRKAREWD